MKKFLSSFFLLCTAAGVAQSTSRGIVIGDNIRVRNEASLSGKEIGKISTGEPLLIEAVSSNKSNVSKDTNYCENYPWVKITAQTSGISGYAFGKYVYAFAEDKGQPAYLEFKMKGETWRLYTGHNYGIGAADENGLTFCDDFSVVVVERVSNGKLFLPSYTRGEHSSYDFPYYYLPGDSGSGESITYIGQNGDYTILYVDVSYQEGTGKKQVRLDFDGRQFTATDTYYKYIDP